MDEHALRVLEYDKVLARVARLTSFSAGRDLALALKPSPDLRVVVERQNMLLEAIRLRAFRSPLNLISAVDVRGALEKAALGGVLDAAELLATATTQKVAQQVKGATGRVSSTLPLMGALGRRLTDRPEVVNEIGRSIDQRGEVLDSASPALGIVRRDIKISHDRLHSRLQDFLNSSSGRLAAQEPIVTLRDGRYVIPIKADFRGEVRGIVHDVSSSGATLFIEPLAVVELANQWRELQIEEQREIERILRRLSALVGAGASVIAENVVVLAELDLLMASARLADELSTGGEGVLPHEESGGEPERWLVGAPNAIDLREARHPLLTTPVPISLRIGDKDRVLLITGPNTGGKTVALKTIGLLCLMAQSGLPIPADLGSQVPVFSEVLADIGDEQSIEQSLSTFSGHLRNIVSLLESAGHGSLVLLDELAAGTDPEEGAALARALLQHLLDRGALTVATTHHGELKLFAHTAQGVQNAAVEFDPVTLAPTYRITIGVPGRSNALAIAARLGVPEEILRAAQESLSPDDVAVDSLLDDLRVEREAASVARQAHEREHRRAEEARTRVEERLAAIDAEQAQRLDEAAMSIESEVEAAREALARAQRLVARQHPPMLMPVVPETTNEELDEAKEAITGAADTAKRLRRRSRRRRRAGGPRIDLILPGVEVWIEGIPMPAEALSAPDRRGEIDISFGGLRARVGVGQVVRVEPKAVVPGARHTFIPPAPFAVEQIEVRGQTLDEALPKIEKFLDDGFRAGVPRLRVVHGKGTGKMRNAVRGLLTKHPLVKAFEFAPPAEGGEGVTVVDMAIG